MLEPSLRFIVLVFILFFCAENVFSVMLENITKK